MRIFYTTQEFTYRGQQYAGVPFLCDDDLEIVEVVSNYLLWLALENARTQSPSTWKSHAETLYDYFSWLTTNSLKWDQLPIKGKHGEEISNLASYRNWSADLIHAETGARKIALSTIRKRLTQIMAFYRWAYDRQRISQLPWEQSFRVVMVQEHHPSMYRHTRSAVRLAVKDNLKPKVQKRPIPLLQLEQCRELLEACSNQTLQLMTKLMLQTGLRNSECRTFPRKYIFDPSAQAQNRRIGIDLFPQDMTIKGSKPRRVYVSWQIMKELFDYINFGDGVQRAKAYRLTFGTKSPFAFLNNQGAPWSEKGLNNAYRKLWSKTEMRPPRLSFRVTPHMLRHTFATLELFAESQRKNLGAALAWVRDRMGHSSIATTTIYVHCLDMYGEQDLNMYQEAIDTLGIEARYGKA